MTATTSAAGRAQLADRWTAALADPATEPTDLATLLAEQRCLPGWDAAAPLTPDMAAAAWDIAVPYLNYRLAGTYAQRTQQDAALDIAELVAGTPGLPYGVLVEFARRGPTMALPTFAARPDLPHRAAADLYRRCVRPGRRALHRYRDVLVALASNPAIRPRLVPVLAAVSASEVRAAVAARPDLPARTARTLLRDTNRTVLSALATNPAVRDDFRVLAALAAATTTDGDRR